MEVCYKTGQCIFTQSSYALSSVGGRSCLKESTEECPNKNSGAVWIDIGGVDPNYIFDTIDIPNDGGDW